MFFFLYSAFDCILSLVLLYLVIVKSIFFKVSVAPHYVSSASSQMPVTTRSQHKCLQNVIDAHFFSSTLGVPLSLSTSSTVLTCNTSTTTSPIIDTTTIPLHESDSRPSTSSSLKVPSSSLISNF